MSDKIKKVLETPEVPEKLRPENIPALIDSMGGKKKNIKRTVFRAVAAAAACTLICAGSVQIINNRSESQMYSNATAVNDAAAGNDSEDNSDDMKTESETKDTAAGEAASENSGTVIAGTAYRNPASYEEMHGYLMDYFRNGMYSGIVGEEDIEYATDAVAEEAAGETGPANEGEYFTKGDQDVYDTLSQVEGIAEADIIKASANAVYYLSGDTLRYVPFDSKTGKFGDSHIIDIGKTAGLSDGSYTNIHEMYLDGDRLAIVANVFNYGDDISATGIFVFDVSGDGPEFIRSSFQTGYYRSSRMKGGIMYLITTQGTDFRLADDESAYERYIPCTGESVTDMSCLPCESIYVPIDWNEDIPYTYTNISAVDIRDSARALNSVSVAGMTGEIYCSADNLYTASYTYYGDKDFTQITRFTLEDNRIEPVASGNIEGDVLSQFSMDEYNGFFRTATTDIDYDTYETVNNVFVMDMNMNIVGSVTGFAETETVKSVSFNGDTGYVVTYEQTDPLFAIDLSDPYNPSITDEFKISGYSSFLRKWDDDLLFGFGIATDDSGIIPGSGNVPIETGVKLVMFDVSDSGDLDECGFTAISGKHYHEYFSESVYDRKALLYSPARNLIGFPLCDNSAEYRVYEYPDEIYSDDINDLINSSSRKPLPVNTYRIYSYENGEFVEKASVEASDYRYEWQFRRGVYIGSYMCIFSDSECVSVDLNDFNETDRIIF